MSEIFSHILILLKGALTGFLYNFIGVSSALFITNFTLEKGKDKALLASLAITLTNLLWAMVAAFSFGYLLLHIQNKMYIYSFFGSVVLLIFAYRLYTKQIKTRIKFLKETNEGASVFLESIIFGLASPEKILGYGALFTLLNTSTKVPFFFEKIPLVIGVGAGSFIWWILYIFLFHKHQEKFFSKNYPIIQKITYLCFGAFGGFGLIYSLVEWHLKH